MGTYVLLSLPSLLCGFNLNRRLKGKGSAHGPRSSILGANPTMHQFWKSYPSPGTSITLDVQWPEINPAYCCSYRTLLIYPWMADALCQLSTFSCKTFIALGIISLTTGASFIRECCVYISSKVLGKLVNLSLDYEYCYLRLLPGAS
jgi:hypothetical protein